MKRDQGAELHQGQHRGAAMEHWDVAFAPRIPCTAAGTKQNGRNSFRCTFMGR